MPAISVVAGMPSLHCPYYAAMMISMTKKTKKKTWEDFLQLTEILPNGCWEWKGRLNNKKRPMFTSVTAYRWAYLYQVGYIPEGYELDHLCLNGQCVNWMHLEAVTKEENLRRQYGEHCPQGHLRSEHRDVQGGCGTCRKQRNLERYYNNKFIGPKPKRVGKRKSHCPQGHPYDKENTFWSGGHQKCKQCNRDRASANRAKKKQQ